LGLDENRIQARWISASEGPEFAKFMNQITEETRKLGPSPLAGDWSD
jgi:F420-non-reducing hydrogenase iron-sulfur subunit